MESDSACFKSDVVTRKFRRLRRVFETRRSVEETVAVEEAKIVDAVGEELDVRQGGGGECSTAPAGTDGGGEELLDARLDLNSVPENRKRCREEEKDVDEVEWLEKEDFSRPLEGVEKGRKKGGMKDGLPEKKRRQTVLLPVEKARQQGPETRPVRPQRRSLRIEGLSHDRFGGDESEEDPVGKDDSGNGLVSLLEAGECKVEDLAECTRECPVADSEPKRPGRRTNVAASGEEGSLVERLKARKSRVTGKGWIVAEAGRKQSLRDQGGAEGKDGESEIIPGTTNNQKSVVQEQVVAQKPAASGAAKQLPSRRRPVSRKQPIVSYSAPDASIERLHREATTGSQLWQTGDLNLKKVPTCFNSIQEYIGVFEPLLFEECRAQLRSVWEEMVDSNGKDAHVHVTVKTVTQRERGWYDVTVLPVEKHVKLFFKEGDVAVVSTPKPGSGARRKARNKGEENKNGESCRVSGIIRRFVPVDTREPHGAILHFYMPHDEPNFASVLAGLQQPDNSWYLTVIGSLTTTQREYVALHNVQQLHLQMVEAILQPRPELFPSHTQQTPPPMPERFTPAFLQHLQNNFNGPQLDAIQWAAAHTAAGMGSGSTAARQEPWPFTLVQGPPGTGKTHTVWGMLNVIHLVQYQRYYAALVQKLAPGSLAIDEPSTSNADLSDSVTNSIEEVLLKMDSSLPQNVTKLCPKPRMLVCAPSNAATDELLARVLDRGFMDGEMRIYRPDVARVGTDSQSRAAQAVSVERRTETLLVRQREEILSWIHQFRIKEMSLLAHIDGLKKELLDIVKSLRSSVTIGVDPEVLTVRDAAREAQNSKMQQLAAAVEEHDKVLVELSRLRIVEGRFKGKEGGYEDARRKLEASFANEAEIVFTTVSSTGRRLFSELTHGFDMVVIDEAAQASEVAVLPPLSLRSSRCVLVGDPQQLPATVISHVANNMQYSRSLFERFQQAGCPATVLTVQYRMHPEIREFPSEHFYKGFLTDSDSIKVSPSEVYHADPLLKPYLFFDINIGRESHGGSVSYQNTLEAQVVVRLYLHLQKVLKGAGVPETAVSVGIITPYKQQLACLQKEFQSVVGTNAATKGVYINTVDAFQGQERDVIIMSCVRASSYGVGFVADVRRMNVALTRARRSLLVIGNAKALSQSDDWTSLIKNARARNCFVPAAFSETNGLLPPDVPSSSAGVGPSRYRKPPPPLGPPLINNHHHGWKGMEFGGDRSDFPSNVTSSYKKGRHR